MAGPYRHQVEIPCVSGQPEDKVVNVWHSDETSLANAQTFAITLTNFYNNVPALGTHGPGFYLGDSLSRTNDACSVKTYDLSDPIPRTPVDELSWTLIDGATGVSPLPRESAVCLSFHATFPSGSPRARRRGRVYLGPLNGAAVAEESATHEMRPSTLFIDDLRFAANELLVASPLWSVYSRVDDAMYHVDRGWVDNALDTQRRRGLAPTARYIWF